MCMSADEMSDDRIREAIARYRKWELVGRAEGNESDARYYARKAANFEDLLAEREQQRATDIEEIFAAVVIDEPALVAV